MIRVKLDIVYIYILCYGQLLSIYYKQNNKSMHHVFVSLFFHPVFSVLKSKLIRRVVNILKNDFGGTPELLFRDADGDEIVVRRHADLT